MLVALSSRLYSDTELQLVLTVDSTIGNFSTRIAVPGSCTRIGRHSDSGWTLHFAWAVANRSAIETSENVAPAGLGSGFPGAAVDVSQYVIGMASVVTFDAALSLQSARLQFSSSSCKQKSQLHVTHAALPEQWLVTKKVFEKITLNVAAPTRVLIVTNALLALLAGTEAAATIAAGEPTGIAHPVLLAAVGHIAILICLRYAEGYVANSVFTIAAHVSSSSSAVELVIGVACLLAAVAVAMRVLYVVTAGFPAALEPREYVHSESFAVRVLLGPSSASEYIAIDDRRATLHLRYRCLYKAYRDDSHWFFVVEMFVSFLQGVVTALPDAACVAAAAAMTVVYMIYFLLLAYRRPVQQRSLLRCRAAFRFQCWGAPTGR